jgi:hypothetical protein
MHSTHTPHTRSLSLPGPGVLQAVRRSLQSYMGLPGWPLFASNRDPTLTEYVGTRQAKDAAAYVNLHTGALSVRRGRRRARGPQGWQRPPTRSRSSCSGAAMPADTPRRPAACAAACP